MSTKNVRLVRNALLWFPQTLLLLVAFSVIPLLSRRAETAVGRWFGRRLACLPRFRKVAMANLRIVYGNSKSEDERKALYRASMEHLGMVVMDYFWFSWRTAARLDRYCVACDETVRRWIKGSFGGAFITMHLGNWEVGALYVARQGRQLASVYKPFGFGWVSRLLLRFRLGQGAAVIPREGAMRGVLRAVRHRQLVALLLDQHTHVRDGGIYVPFFGLPVTMAGAVCSLSKRLASPMLIVAVVHDPTNDRYTIRTYREITGEEAASCSVRDLCAEISKTFERIVLDYPEQWVWSYRRWKRYIPGVRQEAYPYYAHPDPNGRWEGDDPEASCRS